MRRSGAEGGGDERTARSADGVAIHYEVTGEGAPALLFVHGWAFDRRLWDGEVARLSARHRVITMDLAGHGQSGDARAEWTPEAFGRDVQAVAEAEDARGLVLIGHSLGGPVVLEAARRMPERVVGIVLVDTLLDVGKKVAAAEADAFARRLTADYKTAATNLVTQYLLVAATPPAVRERVLRAALALPPRIAIAILRGVWAHDPLPALAEVRAPVRAVNADLYPTNVGENRRHMPGYTAAIVRGSGHYPMLEAPEAFGAALDGALAELAGGRPTTIVYIGTSLDGFIARPDGAIDWMGSPPEEGGEDYGWSEFFPTIDALVMGRQTFEKVLTFPSWPYGSTPVIVLSRTMKAVPERLQGKAEVSPLEPAALLRALAGRGVRRVYVDGGQTIQSFLRADLIDELVITRLPVLIGEGIPLFGPVGRDLTWEHVSTKTFDDGLVKSSYRRQR